MEKNPEIIRLISTLISSIWSHIYNIFALDKRSLALFRVTMAWATLWDLGNRLRDLETFYTDTGTMPRSLVLSHFTTDYWSSLHMFSGSSSGMLVLWIIHAIFAFCMLIGYKTNIATFCTWYMTCSLQTRNIIVFHSGDNVHRMALLWGSLLPLGACFSVDAAFRDKSAEAPSAFTKKGKNKYQHLSAGALAITMQILIMYWSAHRFKTAPEWREKGLAGWMALQLDFFRRPFGDILLWFPTFCKYNTFGVLYWQKYGCFFFFSPIFTGPMRAFGVLGFMTMHVSFFLSMRLGLFGWATVSAITALLPTWFWETLIFSFFNTKKRRDFRLYYKEGCTFCTNICKLASSFCLIPGTEVLPIPETGDQSHHQSIDSSYHSSRTGKLHDEDSENENSSVSIDMLKPRFQWNSNFIVTQDQHGKLHRNWDALVSIADVSPLFWLWKYPLQKMKYFGDELLDLFHDHSELKETPRPRKIPVVVSQEDRIKEFLLKFLWFVSVNSVGAVLLYMLWCVNAQAAGYPQYTTPASLHGLTWSMHFPQNWGMFSPRPPDVNWWYNIKGELDNGTFVELFSEGGLHSMEPSPYIGLTKPPSTIKAFKNHRWFKLFEVGINSHRHADTLRLSFGRWVCREYNKRHSGKQALYKHDIHFVSERLDMQKLDGSRFPPQSSVLWRHQCYYKPGENGKTQ